MNPKTNNKQTQNKLKTIPLKPLQKIKLLNINEMIYFKVMRHFVSKCPVR
ncbi:Uncharacterised protein [Serratia odorifera]|uniref:Uncharacterized protein n=1 Tax=Serratia odorifera TaxID=618 RepID=A0A447KK36_SEROD|nr:Uncharacterised protein [Serratia odorifera]VDZ51414.1 Uncharacterised protein [Serratia odorifera]